MKKIFKVTFAMACCLIAVAACNSNTEDRNNKMSSSGSEQLQQDMDSVNAVLNDSSDTSNSGRNPKYGN